MRRLSAVHPLIAVLVTVAVSLCSPPRAGAAAGTLDEVVQATLASREDLRIVEAEAEKAASRSRRYLFYASPDVRFQASYARTESEPPRPEEVQPGATPAPRDAWFYGLTLAQPLYTGGRATAAWRGAQHLQRSTELGAVLARRALAVAAAEAYLGVLQAAETVRLGEEAVAGAQRHLERSARRVELGEAVENDRLRAEVSLRGLEADLAAAHSRLARARDVVRRLSGLELAESPKVPAPFPEIDGDDAALVAEAEAGRLEPEQGSLAIAAAEQDVRERKGRFLPTLALTANLGEGGDEPDDLRWRWTAGVALELPLYQSGQRVGELRESRLGLEQARLARRAALRDIELEVLGLRRELEAARSRNASLRLAVDAATENLRFAERRYDVGLADSLEVADAQTAATAARVSLAAEVWGREALKLRLAAALGREIFPGILAPASAP